jgi:DNA modification methylase
VEIIKCPICQEEVSERLSFHVRAIHGEDALKSLLLKAKAEGMPDPEIGAYFGVSFNYLEKVITEAYGANITVLKRPKKVKQWEPPNFREETTTVWSFKQRGDWATHDSRYRGNWSPYIPRNVILKYSKPGDLVLDYFVGGGTTAIEAKLLGRRCIARDINPGAIGITLENLRFSPPRRIIYEPEVSVGDARDLSDIPSDSVDLICAHPPYAGIISYSSGVEGDLSQLPVPQFLEEMRKVAQESYRVLKPGGKCAILVGDARKRKQVVPIGFQVIKVFLSAGFILRELVIKRQHNCKATGFWYKRSVELNFLLLAHEYLPIFEKPPCSAVAEQLPLWDYFVPIKVKKGESIDKGAEVHLESTTVWIFKEAELEEKVRINLSARFAAKVVEVEVPGEGSSSLEPTAQNPLILVRVNLTPQRAEEVYACLSTLKKLATEAKKKIFPGGYLAFEIKDIRLDERLYPMALMLWESLSHDPDLKLREIVIVVPEEKQKLAKPKSGDFLEIIHRYLLIYQGG